MNIFYLSSNQSECAKLYHDQHVVKMILESTQLLSNAIQYNGGYSKYAATHMNHPCSVWARESRTHCRWIYKLINELNNEYRYRYNKDCDHKCVSIAKYLINQINLVPDNGLTVPPQCMPDKYKENSTIKAYLKYYTSEKINNKKWSKRESSHKKLINLVS